MYVWIWYFVPGSGQIEFEEFIVLCGRFMEEEPEDNVVVLKELKEIFKLYDKDGKLKQLKSCLRFHNDGWI